MCSFDELYKRFESLNLFIDKYSKYDETTIKILFDNTINRTTTLLDPIEYAIIDIANRNDYFKRSIVDQKLKISPRTSNKYLNKLVDQGIIYKEGIGKEVLYYKVKK